MKNDNSSWAIGGGVILGLGAGLFVLQTYGGLAFVGLLLGGLGIGLIVAAILSKCGK
jgi:hypothetical protein